jgi:hypothetical protein
VVPLALLSLLYRFERFFFIDFLVGVPKQVARQLRHLLLVLVAPKQVLSRLRELLSIDILLDVQILLSFHLLRYRLLTQGGLPLHLVVYLLGFGGFECPEFVLE